MSEFLRRAPGVAHKRLVGRLMAGCVLAVMPVLSFALGAQVSAEQAACDAAAQAAAAPWIAAAKSAVQVGDRQGAAHAGCMAEQQSALACLQAANANTEIIRRVLSKPCI